MWATDRQTTTMMQHFNCVQTVLFLVQSAATCQVTRHVVLVTGCKKVPEEYSWVQRGDDEDNDNSRPGNRHHGMTFRPALVQRIAPSSGYAPRAATLDVRD